MAFSELDGYLSAQAPMLVTLYNAAAGLAAVRRFEPQVVFHLAAQPLVRRSYREPTATFDTNVMGLVNLLEAAPEIAGEEIYAALTASTALIERDVKELTPTAAGTLRNSVFGEVRVDAAGGGDV